MLLGLGVVALAVALLTRTTGHTTTTRTDAGSLPTRSSKLPPVTIPHSTSLPGALPPTTGAGTTPTTAVSTCPSGSVDVSLSLSAQPVSAGKWRLTLQGSATNTSTGSLQLRSVIADVKDQAGTTLLTIPADISGPKLDPHGSTSLSGTAIAQAAAAPTVSFGSASAVWTGAGTAHCPVPH